MDVMETLSVHDLFQGLQSTSLLDSGFHDGDGNRDSLLDLLAQSFPDMLTQSYGHLSSLPLDATDLELCIQDEDYQECDSADDIILQEFACEVQNILSVTKRSNVENALDLDDSLVSSGITPLTAEPEEHFSPIKKLCPDQIDLLMGPLLDEDEDDDVKTEEKIEKLPIQHVTLKPNGNALNKSSAGFRKLQAEVPKGKPLVAYVKPVLKTCSEPVVSCLPIVSTVVQSTKSVVNASKIEDESSDEVDIETVDDDELNGRSGAEVLSAKLADIGCQAARVRVLPPRGNPESKSHPFTVVSAEKSPATEQSQLPSKTLLSTVPSFPVVKPSPKPKEKEQSPSLVVEKIKQSAIVPRSSILIPHQGPPPQQSRTKVGKQEFAKVLKSNIDVASTALPPSFDARTLDHDYCNTAGVEDPTEALSKLPSLVKELQDVKKDLDKSDESIILSILDVPSMGSNLFSECVQSDLDRTECEVIDVPTSELCQEVVASVVKSESEDPLSFCEWHLSCSQSPYLVNRFEVKESRKRSSCSPSSLSSHSICRSRSRSSSRGRKSRSQTRHHRKQSRGRSRSRHSMKRTCYKYSRSSSQSSFSSRSRSRSRSRSLSRSRSGTSSQSRSRAESWEYKRTYNRAPVMSYNWAQDKRRYDEKTREIEERRVVYVGRLPDGTTKNDLRHRFGCFGPIQEVSVHFRDSGHNYGFVTFSFKRDAYQAVEHGNDDPNLPKFDLSFGGRRQFCRQRYADLDSQYNNYTVRRPSPANDFDSLLRAAKLKQNNY